MMVGMCGIVRHRFPRVSGLTQHRSELLPDSDTRPWPNPTAESRCALTPAALADRAWELEQAMAGPILSRDCLKAY